MSDAMFWAGGRDKITFTLFAFNFWFLADPFKVEIAFRTKVLAKPLFRDTRTDRSVYVSAESVLAQRDVSAVFEPGQCTFSRGL